LAHVSGAATEAFKLRLKAEHKNAEKKENAEAVRQAEFRKSYNALTATKRYRPGVII